jgi:hypothetical protein
LIVGGQWGALLEIGGLLAAGKMEFGGNPGFWDFI